MEEREINLVPETTNISIVRGDTLLYGIQIQIGEELVEGADAIYFSVKQNKDSEEYVFQKSLGDGIAYVQDESKYRVRVSPEDTANLPLGAYYYDLQIIKNGDVYTVQRGKLKLEWEITEEEA